MAKEIIDCKVKLKDLTFFEGNPRTKPSKEEIQNKKHDFNSIHDVLIHTHFDRFSHDEEASTKDLRFSKKYQLKIAVLILWTGELKYYSGDVYLKTEAIPIPFNYKVRIWLSRL